MIDFAALLEGISLLASLEVMMYILAGLAVGILLGATPGVGGTLGIGLLLPLTYHMTPINGIMLLSAIFTGSVYAGGVTAILLNVPGTASSVATTFDGYQMTMKGKQNQALGIGLGSSVIGCVLGYIIIIIFLVPLGKFALKFGPPEMVLVSILVLTIIGTMKGGMVRAFMVGAFGLMLGTVGATTWGRARGTYGILALYEGIPLVPSLMGLLAVAEMFSLIQRNYVVKDMATVERDPKVIVKSMLVPFHQKLNSLRSLIVGMIVGLLPAVGSSVASIVSYSQAKVASKHPEEFGKGSEEGIVAAEIANNASEPGSMATMLTFGIPGSSATAMLMAAFMVHGLTPGPFLVRDSMDLTYAVLVGNLFQGIVLLGMGLLFIIYFSKIVLVPTKYIVPVVVVLSFIGAYSLRAQIADGVVMLTMCFLAYIMRKIDFPVLALLIGLILGATLDTQISRTVLMFEGRYDRLFQRPLFVGLLVVIAVIIGWQVWKSRKEKEKQAG